MRTILITHRTLPLQNGPQKLSKIETLRFALNYIEALAQMLSQGQTTDRLRLAWQLCRGMSQSTANLVHSYLGITSAVCVEQQKTVDDASNNQVSSSTHEASGYEEYNSWFY